MNAINFYHDIIKKNIDTGLNHGLNKQQNGFKNILHVLIRKNTSQLFRLIGLRIKYLKKIPYFSTVHSLDYLEYIIKNNPVIPYSYYPKQDKKEIDYFLEIMLKGAYSDGYYETDFGDKWKKFEKVRYENGKNMKYNMVKKYFTFHGFKSIVYPDTGIFSDKYELKLLKRKKHNICIDLGAYIGDSAYIINEHFNPEKIYAFEPEKSNRSVLVKNILLNDLEDKIIPIGMATGSKNGYANFIGVNASSGVSDGKGYKVKITTIDDFIKKNNISTVDLIKMDIEGAETDTVNGAKETIKKYKPDLIIAIYHRGQDFFEMPKLLKKISPDYNFRFVALSGSSPVVDRFLYASTKKI